MAKKKNVDAPIQGLGTTYEILQCEISKHLRSTNLRSTAHHTYMYCMNRKVGVSSIRLDKWPHILSSDRLQLGLQGRTRILGGIVGLRLIYYEASVTPISWYSVSRLRGTTGQGFKLEVSFVHMNRCTA